MGDDEPSPILHWPVLQFPFLQGIVLGSFHPAELRRAFRPEIIMTLETKPGHTLRVTISKSINRASARKTIERLFMQDKTHSGPLEARSANFIPLPKRRGGCIWTKRCNKVHPPLNTGDTATVRSTPQTTKDLKSVASFVTIA
jgi:hypothetical protein